MHIPEGFLSPTVSLATGAVSLAVVVPSAWLAGRRWGPRAAPLMGTVGAFLFAGQMINFPIPGVGCSGHLLGGTLAAVLLGPWAGITALTVVLLLQALLFQDGGVLALGANVFNMAVLGAGVGRAVFTAVRGVVGGPAGVVAGSVVSAWLTVVLASLSCAVQLSLSDRGSPGLLLNALAGVHVAIGLGEAVITGLVVSALLASRPDILEEALPSHAPGTGEGPDHHAPTRPGAASGASLPARVGSFVVAGLAAALVVAVFLSPFASGLDDGLEFAVGKLNDESGTSIHETDDPAWKGSPFPDYRMSAETEGGSTALVAVETSAVGAMGTLATFAVAWLLGRGAVAAGAARRKDATVAAG